MNYYPNFYQNYGMQQAQPLNGKIVDSIDMVRASEVPMGGYAIFPKGDLTEIYLKMWNPNGTTSIVTFKPDAAQAQSEQNLILERLTNLETKIDQLSIVKKERSANEY